MPGPRHDLIRGTVAAQLLRSHLTFAGKAQRAYSTTANALTEAFHLMIVSRTGTSRAVVELLPRSCIHRQQSQK